ncbi:MAG: hypothetical protein ACR2FF_10000 [Mycobacteriales bacterium]
MLTGVNQSRSQPVRAKECRDDRLVGFAAQAHERSRVPVLCSAHRRDEGSDNCVNERIGQRVPDGGRELFGSAVRADVDRG